MMPEPSLDDASGDLMIARGLPDADLARLDLRDQLTFEFHFELSTNLSHCEYWTPRPRADNIGAREGLWKMPQLWKSTKVAFGDFFLMISTNCLEKPPQKTLRLSHIYHSPGYDCCLYSFGLTFRDPIGLYSLRRENSPVDGAHSIFYLTA